MTDALVSILVVTYRQHGLLPQCLAALDRATEGVETETIVVVNGVPLQPEHRAARDAGAMVIESSVNLGFPGGLHLARSHARGRYLAVVQDDAVVDPDWLTSLLQVLDDDHSVGAAGSCIEYLDGEPLGHGILVSGDGWLEILEPSERPEPTWAVDACFSAACVVRAEAWDGVGGPNPRLFPLWMVDVDLGLRLAEADWSVLTVRDSVARHLRHGSSTTLLRRYLDERHRRVMRREHRALLAVRPFGRFGTVEVAAWLEHLDAEARRRRARRPGVRVERPAPTRSQLEHWARRDAQRIRIALPVFRVRSAIAYRWRRGIRCIERKRR